MNQSPLLLRTAAMLALCCGTAFAQPAGPAPRVELFSAPNYQGQKLVLTGTARNLDRTGFNDRAQSVRVTGSWTFCEDSEFDDRCITLSRDEPDLAALGFANSISSARIETPHSGPEPARPDPYRPNPYRPDPYRPDPYRPAPQPYDSTFLEGSTATFFPEPRQSGRPIPACDFGNRGPNCARSSADRFCRAEGFAASGYSNIRRGRRGDALIDVLCLN